MSKLRVTVLCALAAAALAASLVGLSASGISGFTAALDLDRPPIAQVPAAVDEAGPPLARRVVLVIIDGLGDSRTRGLPELDALRAAGVDGTASAHFPTLSLPNYAAILTGVPPSWSGVRSNQFAGLVSVDTLTQRVQAANRRVAYVADVSPSLPNMLPGWDEARVIPWKGLLRSTSLEVLRGDPALTVFLLDDCDHFGHLEGAGSAAYRRAALGYDALLGALWAEIDPARDTLVVVADHGHLARGGHGGPEPEVVHVPLVLAGAGVRPGARLDDAKLDDVAPTLAALLGVPAPGHALGRTLVEALDVSPARRAELAWRDGRRIAGLLAGVAGPRARVEAEAGRIQGRRLVGGLGVLGLSALALLGLLRGGVVTLDRRVVLVGGVAFAGLVFALRCAFADYCVSPSIPGDGVPVTRAVLLGLFVGAAELCAAAAATQGRASLVARLRAGLGLAVLTLVGAVAVAVATFAFEGEPLAVRFFGPTLMVMLPGLHLVALYQSAASALIASGAVVVFYARATRPARPAQTAPAPRALLRRRQVA